MRNKHIYNIIFAFACLSASSCFAQSPQSIFDRARSAPAPAPKPQTVPPKPVIQPEDEKINDPMADQAELDLKGAGLRTGTGFFVDNTGHIVTAAHVVAGCGPTSIKVRGLDKNVIAAKRLTVDVRNDLALLRIDSKDSRRLAFNLTPQLGEDVYAFGYPLFGELAQSGNFTAGIVTSLAGLKEDTTRFQMSAAIQAGNSGGPVFDQKGNVVGVVLAKLTSKTDSLQNVNFSLRARLVEIFLSSNGIEPLVAKESDEPLTKMGIASRAQASTVLVGCVFPIPKKKEGEK